ncbi:MAG TPA: DNA-3-methyladenine glycosylase I [Rhodospirillales bacterium]|jgi:3-methyladenine DNA glycosylase Tag|nr:DNA-3-methyladenine glycosylase I [Rhodospirillales bacterium]HJO69774.1 DNA-3-methyladenine glycosylase I [Rhodospirillales bacterium]
MVPFETVFEAAATRAGGAAALETRMPVPKSAAELRGVDDDRYLSLMSRRVFRAGLKQSLVDAKWPAFEDAFMGFDPKRVRAMNDEALEALLSEKRLIRHGPKMRAVMRNAAAVCALAEDTGGVGAYLADWPASAIVGLWDDIAKRFTQMGGRSAPVFLRMAGKDTFLLTDDVARALVRWGAIEGEPTGKAGRALVQAAFNRWAEESARPLSQISMALALSAG